MSAATGQAETLGTARHDAALSTVGRALQAIADAQEAEARAVAAARAAGATWAGIANQLGVKQPNAVRKYGAIVKALLTDGK
jgi:hypothetical protein